MLLMFENYSSRVRELQRSGEGQNRMPEMDILEMFGYEQ